MFLVAFHFKKLQKSLIKPPFRTQPLPATSHLAICNNTRTLPLRTPPWVFVYLLIIPYIIVEKLFSHLFPQKWNKFPTCTNLSDKSVSVGCDWASKRRSQLRKTGKRFIVFSNSCLHKHMLSVCLFYPLLRAFFTLHSVLLWSQITTSLLLGNIS